MNEIARYYHDTYTLTIGSVGENCYPSEPIYIQDSENKDKAWVITVVYNGKFNTSEVWIYDADKLDAEPVCKLELPHVIPHSFHGTWKPN